MNSFSDIIFYVFAFISVYAQVFLLVTFFENKKRIKNEEGEAELSRYPSVTIIVPCWNEERTVYKTIRSVLNLNYPKNKVKLILVDDGSTDGTWKVISKFAKYQNVRVFRKENGGKYTALNLGLAHTDTEFFGCLDADSVAHKDSLLRLIGFFEKYPDSMAVTPSIIAKEPKGIVQRAQKAEYFMYIYMKKMLGCLGAIHVTPGPLTIFRKRVFDELGPYRHAHNTEDMEIAYRMQKHRYTIEQCHNAYVYTDTPISVKKLFKQRLRWIYGFINNTIDYKDILFRKKYGNFSVFTIPSNILSTVAASYIFGRAIWSAWTFLSKKFLEYQAAGVELSPAIKHADSFFVNTNSSFLITFVVYFLLVLSVVLGYRMVNKSKKSISMDMIYFFSIFTLVGPFWLAKALFNTIVSRRPSWR